MADPNKRLAVLEKMVSAGNADSFAYYGLGMEYRKLGRVADAEQAYESDGYIWIQVTPAGTNQTGWVAIDFITPAG